VVNLLTEMIQALFWRGLMNFNGLSKIVRNSAASALAAAIALAATLAVTLLSLARLIIWASPKERGGE
jgi:hypothetical protein